MAEQNPEAVPNEVENNYSTPASDPKNMQEVTQYVRFWRYYYPFHLLIFPIQLLEP